MSKLKTVVAVLAGLAIALSGDPALAKSKAKTFKPGVFDYYVLSLTWTPGFCATHTDPAECGHGLGFGLHGLWPQFNGGKWPETCSKVPLTSPVRQKYEGIYPSPTMIVHEWGKHGTCSGLKPTAYLELSDTSHKAVAIPPAYASVMTVAAKDVPTLKQAFLDANPGLPADGFQAVTAGGILTEIHVCLAKDTHAFRPCS